MRVNAIVEDSIVDGPGLRLAVFVQGCSRGCPNCHNPQTHDPSGGYDISIDDIMAKRNPMLRGITISGGEPLNQAEEAYKLAVLAKTEGLDVWVYTGYSWDEVMDIPYGRELLAWTDVIVTEPFVEDRKSLGLKWRGSTNQHVIDVQTSLKMGTCVLWEGEQWK